MKKLTTSKIICSKCKTPKKTQKKQMEKLISVFGSLENVHAKYHCIECRRKYNVRKDGKAKPIRKKRKPKPEWVQTGEIPNWMKNICGKKERPAVGPTKRWVRPEGVSVNKWESAIKSTVEYGKKNGILIPAKLLTKK